MSYKSSILPISLALAWASSAQAAFNPIPLQSGSYTHDMIVEKTASSPALPGGATTASMDGGINNDGDTWNEQGYFTSDTSVGLPPAGSTLTTNKYSYTFASTYAGPNAIVLDTGHFTNANWKLSSPSSLAALSFLTSGGNGGVQFRYTAQRQDGTSDVGVTNSADWFFVNTRIAWVANGRVNAQSFTLDNYNSGNPRLYSIDVALSTSTSPITNILIECTGGNGHTCIMAISGAASLADNFTAVHGSGYNADIVVEASAPRRWDLSSPGSVPTTTTMDGGVANTGNTWFEQGYCTVSNRYGIPAAGSTFTTEGDAAHSFTMAPDYTQNNAFFVDPATPTAVLPLATPTSYSALSVLTAAANGNPSLEVVVSHADSSVETNYITSPDWFGNAPRAWTSRGRFNVSSGVFENLNNDNPRLYYADFALANTVSPVTSVTVNFNSTGGRAAVFALSGAAGAVPPLITSQPTSVRTWAGSNITFTVVAAGTAPLSYQWQKATSGVFSDIVGQTGSSITLNNVQVVDNSDYRLVVSNAAGSVNSQPATLIVLSPLPVITLPTDTISAYQPNGGSSPGGEAVFHAIDSKTDKYLNFATGVSPFTGPVGFVVTPSIGRTIVSAMRFYAANDAPERDPANYILEGSVDGTTYTLISSNAVTLPDGRNGGGAALDPIAQNVTQVLFPNTTSYASYRLSFTKLKGGASLMQIGEIEMLGVVDTSGIPVVTQAPVGVTVYVGTSLQFTAAATGSPAPTYQWKRGVNGSYVNLTDGGNISGSKSDTLSISSAQFSDAMDYVVVVSNSKGTVPSAPANLTVISTLGDVTFPGDTVSSFGDESDVFWGAATNAANAIDNATLLWRNGGSGFSAAAGFPPFSGPVGLVVEPTAGTGSPTNTLVSGIRVYTADGDILRDPADYKLEGSNDGGLSYKVISSGALSLPTGRNANAQIDPLQLSMQEVLFANSVSYTSYRLTFNHTKNDQLANSMQISEIELLGTTAAPSVNLSFSRTGSSLSITSSAPGTLQSTTALNGANTVWVNEGPISGTRVLTIGAGIKLFRVLAQ